MGDWKVKIKISIIVVLIMILFASTIAIAAKPSDLPEQAYNKGQSEEKIMERYFHFNEIASMLYEKTGKVPPGLMNILSSFGR
jgi:hypothetical protein